MGTESGQPLDAILERKELERQAGGGVFYWGIGQSLGQRFLEFVREVRRPVAVFSPMISSSQKDDANIASVVRWRRWVDESGREHDLPPHVLVTSKMRTKRGLKCHHYALVCKSASPLVAGKWPDIKSGRLTNYRRGTRIGGSQVTSVVEVGELNETRKTGSEYKVVFVAELTYPYIVKLTHPSPFNSSKVVDLNEIGRAAGWNSMQWLSFVSCEDDGCEAVVTY